MKRISVVFTEASASPHSLQALSVRFPSAGAVHREQECQQLAEDWGKAETRGREWWVCNVCGCQRDEQEGLGISSELVLWRLRRGNKGRVEYNRTRQWHWDNLWSYLGIFNWPVSFSHLMNFHKDSSLPLVLSSRSSLDFPADGLSGFLCFVSPPFLLQSSTELPGFVVSKQKERFSKGVVWENLMLFSTKREI